MYTGTFPIFVDVPLQLFSNFRRSLDGKATVEKLRNH
jgi:hypothetical protein